jgi:transcriptional regulator with XRE-family HTH domain
VAVELPPHRLIGATVRELRARTGVSLLELARRSGVARGTITALEAGDGNPTVDTLYALANALGVPLSELLERPPESGAVHVVRAGEGPAVEGAALDAHLLVRIERPGLLGELYAIRFRPGAARHAQPHPFGVEEYLHLHSGRVRVGPEDAPVELRAGDHARYSGAVAHVYEALGGDPAAGTLLILTPSPLARSPLR